MSIAPTRSDSSAWWLAPVAVAFLALVGLGIYWTPADSAPPDETVAPQTIRTVPPPVPDGPSGLHAVSTTNEQGVKVIRIQVVPGGDELVVDAATGRLIEARPAGKAVSPAGGRPTLFAPFTPVP
jgi:hypothetical protein